MLHDIKKSIELTNKLEQSKKKLLDIQMQVKILQNDAWPLSPGLSGRSTALLIPPMLQPAIRNFKEIYNRFYSRRKLTWLFNLSTGIFLILYSICIMLTSGHLAE